MLSRRLPQVEGTLDTGLERALRWLRRGLYLTQISPRHVRMAAKNLANNLPAVYRDGAEMVSHVAAAATLDGGRANEVAAGPMQQQPFLQAAP